MTPSSKPAAWRPLITGDLAERAREAVLAIAAELGDPDHVPGQAEGPRYASLAGGDAGMALFFAYLALGAEAVDASRGNHFAELASAYLDRAIGALGAEPMRPILFGGFTGVAWTADHLDGRLFESDDDEDADDENEIDAGLVTFLDRPDWYDDYDLISGLAGYGVYALGGLPRPRARRCLELVVDHLAKLSQAGSPGRTWFTPPERLPPLQLEVAPDGYFNLGVAHGVPAVLAVLAHAVAAGVAVEVARPLLDEGVAWLLAQEHDDDVVRSRFDSWWVEGQPPQGSRLAWCYGDLGIAAALAAAARAVGRADWEREALRVARHGATRTLASAGVRDAGLCHGAAGIGHLFNRLHQASGDPELARAARFWLAETLGYRKAGEGIAGFLSLGPTADSLDVEWHADPGFLTGVAGIGLALVGALSGVEPAWDRVLLVDVPPRSAAAVRS